MFVNAYAWLMKQAGLIAGFCICVLAAFLWGYHSGKVRTQDKYAAAALIAEQKSNKASLDLASKINESVRLNNEAQTNLQIALAASLERLRNRPVRRVVVPGAAPASCEGSTGIELSRPDAEFLERFASEESQRWKLNTLACYKREDELRNAMCVARTGKPCL